MEQELFDNKYRKEKYIGGGAFSDVWKVTDITSDVTLALKIFKSGANVDTDGVEMLKHEYALTVNILHRNLLTPRFFDICEGQPYLILPFCERGSIKSLIKKMSEEETWKLLRDISSALEYLHTRTPAIIHQDIKPDNILIANDGSYMLTDFGVSTSLKVKATQSHLSFDDNLLDGSAGTIAYMPPNKFSRKNRPIFANDVWSVGATVFEMLTGDVPFGQSGGLLQKKGAEVPDIPEQFSSLLNDTIRSCMDEDPAKRPFASKLFDIACDALKHPEKLIPMNQNEVVEISSDNIHDIQNVESGDVEAQQHDSESNEEFIVDQKMMTSSDSYEDKNNKLYYPASDSIPSWIIYLSVVGGIAAGALLAWFM